MEPEIAYVTIRVSDSDDWLDIECRMTDGQKGTFIQVDKAFPMLALRIFNFLNGLRE